jgi:CubicO group peptidase (beta-lactamase class C family)
MKPVSLWCPLLFVALTVTPAVRAETAWPLPAVTPRTAGFSDEKLETLHRNLRQNIDAGKYSGYIMLLARDGRVVDWRAYGWQDVAAQVPMQKDSIVRIFSMSKVVTSVAALILLEDGRLKLNDPVEKYLPALKDRKVFIGGTADAPILVPADRPITIHDLLTHTSGYYYAEPWSADSPDLIELFKRVKPFEAANLDEFVTRVAQLPLQQQPGTQFHYAIGFDLLGAIVEKISGQTYDVFLQQRIFGPLGMRDTGFWVPTEKRNRLALVYHRGAEGKLVPADERNHNDVGPGRGMLSGGGGLYSTAADYARFAQMLLNGGRLDDVRILSRKTVELMTQNHIAHLANPHPFDRAEQGYGLGVRIMTDLGMSPNPGSFGCFGWDGAATTIVQMDPKERTVAILLCQHVPFNEDDIFSTFINGYYSSLDD